MKPSGTLAGKRVCVTGGGGFLGSFVVEGLQRRGYQYRICCFSEDQESRVFWVSLA